MTIPVTFFYEYYRQNLQSLTISWYGSTALFLVLGSRPARLQMLTGLSNLHKIDKPRNKPIIKKARKI